jgi:hypothetical protein
MNRITCIAYNEIDDEDEKQQKIFNLSYLVSESEDQNQALQEVCKCIYQEFFEWTGENIFNIEIKETCVDDNGEEKEKCTSYKVEDWKDIVDIVNEIQNNNSEDLQEVCKYIYQEFSEWTGEDIFNIEIKEKCVNSDGEEKEKCTSYKVEDWKDIVNIVNEPQKDKALPTLSKIFNILDYYFDNFRLDVMECI